MQLVIRLMEDIFVKKDVVHNESKNNLDNKNNETKTNENEGISLRDLFGIIRKHILAILLLIGLGTVCGLGYNFIEPKVYEANATMLVSPSNNNSSEVIGSVSEYQYSSYISKTYVVFITQDIVMDKVSDDLKSNLGLTVSTKELQKNTTATLESSSLVVKVNYTSSDAKTSQKIANYIVKDAVEVANFKNSETNEPSYKLLYGNIAVLSEAKEGTKVSHLARNVLIGLACGVVIAIIYTWIREGLNNYFKDSNEVESTLGLPVLSEIPFYDVKIDSKEKKGSK